MFGDPASRILRGYFDGAVPAGFATADLAPACGLPAALRADRVAVQGLFTAGGSATACYRDGDAYGLLVSGPHTAVDADGVFTGSYGLLVSVQGSYDDAGKLAVDVVQLKGADLAEFLDSDDGREKAMESRKRWSGFLDDATGYSAKQRGDKAKEEAKKFSKAKSAIKMAHKSMELMKNLDQATIDTAHQLIAELETKIEAGTPPSETLVKKLDKLF